MRGTKRDGGTASASGAWLGGGLISLDQCSDPIFYALNVANGQKTNGCQLSASVTGWTNILGKYQIA